MTDQDQRVTEGSTALQAARDIVVVHQGISPDKMSEILVSMATQLSLYRDEAMQVVNARMDSFRDEILKRFAEEGQANSAAFRDPDFQYLIGEAQNAYARSGDEAVRDTLVDIIARRSLETGRTRLALTLNDAATKAPFLTAEEFAALSLVYTKSR